MRKGKTVMGQDIYSVSDGLRVDSVKDLVLEDGDDGVVALLVSEGGLLSSSRVIPFASVVRFGPSAVMIDTAASVVPATDEPRVHEILDRKGTLLGTRVMTEEGEDLGTIADVYFDEGSGRVTGYEVSGGRVDDLVHGSSYLPFDHIRTIGTDAVITTGAAREVVDAQQGGLAAAVDGVRSSVAEHVPASGADGSDGPGDPAANDPDGSLVGARAQRDLLDRDGSVVIASGQAVTLELVERARAEGNLEPLYGAVGRTRPVPAGEQANEAVGKVADTAADLWGRFTSRLSEMTDAAGQRLDAQQTRAQLDRINDAIGRPVTKVMLDRDDSVILDLGDLVTHQAVQRADDAGLLDSLLASVYKAEDVTFSRDELRARIAGDSTVEKASGGASVVEDLEAKLAAPADTGERADASDQDEPGAEPTRGDDGAAADAGLNASTEADEETAPSAKAGQAIGQRPDGQGDQPRA